MAVDLGSNAEDWGSGLASGAPRIREGFPTWVVQDLGDGDVAITCPKVEGRCGYTAIVHGEKWRGMPFRVKTRACPYCFKAARVPGL